MRPYRLACAVALSAGIARGEALRLSWDAEDGCASREQIEAGVETVLGRPIWELSSSWTRVEASAKRQGEEWELRVRVVGHDGSVNERRLAAPTCAEAGDAAIAVLSTSLTAKPAEPAELEERPRERPFVPLVSARPAPATIRTTRAPEQTREEDALTPFRISGSFGLDTSVLDSTAPLLELRLGLEGARFAAYGLADVFAAQTITLEGGFAELGLWTAGVLGCYRWLGGGGDSAWSSRGCVGGELGRITASGRGFSDARDDSATWGAFRAELDLGLRLSRAIALRAAAGGLAQVRTLYVAVSPERVYETPALTARALLGVEAAF